PQGAGGGVEADGGGRREVEALGPPVQGYPDPQVGRVGQVAGQPVRLRAEQPRGRAAQSPGVGQFVKVGGAVRVGGEDGQPGGAHTATRPCGATVSASAARPPSVTGETRSACSARSAWRASASGVPNSSSTAPARSASRTAWGPSTRKRRASSRSRRRSRRRA